MALTQFYLWPLRKQYWGNKLKGNQIAGDFLGGGEGWD